MADLWNIRHPTKMASLPFLKVFLVAALIDLRVFSTRPAKCERIIIGGIAYRRNLLAAIDGYPTDLQYDPRNGNIFFMLHKRNSTRGLHMLMHGSLGIKKLPISAELKVQCLQVDTPNDIVYIGTYQGLVLFDYSKDEITPEKVIGEDDVKNMFIDFDNHMYIITGALHEIFRINNGTVNVKRFEKVPKAYNMRIDRNGNIFYENIDGKLYFFSSELYEPVEYKGFSKYLTHILDINKEDETVVVVKGAIYKLTTTNDIPLKIGQFGFKVTAFKFDSNDDILVGTKGKIFRYRYMKAEDACPSEDYLY